MISSVASNIIMHATNSVLEPIGKMLYKRSKAEKNNPKSKYSNIQTKLDIENESLIFNDPQTIISTTFARHLIGSFASSKYDKLEGGPFNEEVLNNISNSDDIEFRIKHPSAGEDKEKAEKDPKSPVFKLNCGLTKYVIEDLRKYLTESIEATMMNQKNPNHKATERAVTLYEIRDMKEKLGNDVKNVEAIKKVVAEKVEKILARAEVSENGTIFFPRYKVISASVLDKKTNNIIMSFPGSSSKVEGKEYWDSYKAMKFGNIPISFEISTINAKSIYRAAKENGYIRDEDGRPTKGNNKSESSESGKGGKFVLTGFSRGANIASYASSQIKENVSLMASATVPICKKMHDCMLEGIRNKNNPDLYKKESISLVCDKDLLVNTVHAPYLLKQIALSGSLYKVPVTEFTFNSGPRHPKEAHYLRHMLTESFILDYAFELQKRKEEQDKLAQEAIDAKPKEEQDKSAQGKEDSRPKQEILNDGVKILKNNKMNLEKIARKIARMIQIIELEIHESQNMAEGASLQSALGAEDNEIEDNQYMLEPEELKALEEISFNALRRDIDRPSMREREANRGRERLLSQNVKRHELRI